MRRISYYAFNNCVSLSEVALGDNLAVIEQNTFYGCSSLKSIIIPAKVNKIGANAFSDCTRLNTVIFQGNAPELDTTNGSIYRPYPFDNADNLTIYYPSNASGWNDIIYRSYYDKINFVSYNPANGLPDVNTPPVVTPTPTPTQPPGSEIQGFKCEAISVGAKLAWNPISGGMGYRVYRSENAIDEGISITDFYITSNEFIDVNAKANTTYYYSVRQVIKEANPFDGRSEELGPATAKIKVTMGKIAGEELIPPTPTAQKKFILMTLNNPYMSVNGINQEIDPGRGTTPLLLNSRTVVPIRAIVEGMGGNVGWQDYNNEISLNRQQDSVRMWLDSFDITVNGSQKTIDVAPTTINDRTMVPIRFATENLGCAVDWLNSTSQIVIVYY